jgi:hypothetical protein
MPIMARTLQQQGAPGRGGQAPLPVPPVVAKIWSSRSSRSSLYNELQTLLARWEDCGGRKNSEHISDVQHPDQA